MLWRLNIAAVLVLGVIVVAGCKGKAKETAENKYEPAAESDSDSGTAVVSPSDNEERSPASTSNASIPVDAEPQFIVENYIKALNDGNTPQAEALLTEVARIETRRAELVVQPAWSTRASYQVTRVNFATDRPIRAEVATEWVERDSNGATADFTIVWMLFKQPHNGWRISGMKTHFAPGGSLVFLNFEDPSDMIKRWEQGILDAERESEVRNADGGGNPIR